jgi:hypothetical protein
MIHKFNKNNQRIHKFPHQKIWIGAKVKELKSICIKLINKKINKWIKFKIC